MRITASKQLAIFRTLGLMLAALILAGLVFTVNPVHAALQSHVISGTVSAVDVDGNSIEIETPEGTFAGSAPNEYALHALKLEEPVIAVSLGTKGGDWIFISRLNDSGEILSDCYGDIAVVNKEGCGNTSGEGGFCDIYIRGNYEFQYTNHPDCSSCSGCNCRASQTEMTITDANGQRTTKRLSPGDSFTHKGERLEADVIFISGEAPAYPQCSDQPCAGPQPVSNFVISIGIRDDNLSSNDDNSSCFISTAACCFFLRHPY